MFDLNTAIFTIVVNISEQQLIKNRKWAATVMF